MTKHLSMRLRSAFETMKKSNVDMPPGYRHVPCAALSHTMVASSRCAHPKASNCCGDMLKSPPTTNGRLYLTNIMPSLHRASHPSSEGPPSGKYTLAPTNPPRTMPEM